MVTEDKPTDNAEILYVSSQMYTPALQRYMLGNIIVIANDGTLESIPNTRGGKFKIVEDPSLKAQNYRMVDGTIGSWPRSFCPCQVNAEVVDAEDPTKDGPYIVLNGRTIAEFSGTAEERIENVRLWQEALKELRR